MKERGMIFSAPMIRAILAGKESQTRRVVKLPIPSDANDVFAWFGGELSAAPNGCAPDGLYCRTASGLRHIGTCPYGQPGDRLWCKYAHWYKRSSDLTPEIVWCPECPNAVHRDHHGTWVSDLASSQHDIEQHGGFKKRPSIHMPRWASRITLEVKAVHVEKLNNITPTDCQSEGIGIDPRPASSGGVALIEQFARLWESINGKGSWASNPWVWVIEFERLKP